MHAVVQSPTIADEMQEPSPTATESLKALQEINKLSTDDTSILATLTGPRGLIAAIIMSGAGALCSWKSSTSPGLLLHALLGIEIPLLAATEPQREEAVAQLMAISIYRAQLEGDG